MDESTRTSMRQVSQNGINVTNPPIITQSDATRRTELQLVIQTAVEAAVQNSFASLGNVFPIQALTTPPIRFPEQANILSDLGLKRSYQMTEERTRKVDEYAKMHGWNDLTASANDEQRLYNDMIARRKMLNETNEEYFHDKVSKARMCGISDRHIITYVITGLNEESLIRALSLREYESPEELLHYILQAEERVAKAKQIYYGKSEVEQNMPSPGTELVPNVRIFEGEDDNREHSGELVSEEPYIDMSIVISPENDITSRYGKENMEDEAKAEHEVMKNGEIGRTTKETIPDIMKKKNNECKTTKQIQTVTTEKTLETKFKLYRNENKNETKTKLAEVDENKSETTTKMPKVNDNRKEKTTKVAKVNENINETKKDANKKLKEIKAKEDATKRERKARTDQTNVRKRNCKRRQKAFRISRHYKERRSKDFEEGVQKNAELKGRKIFTKEFLRGKTATNSIVYGNQAVANQQNNQSYLKDILALDKRYQIMDNSDEILA